MLGVNYQMQNCSDKLPNDESDTITLSLEIEEKYKPNLKTVYRNIVLHIPFG